MQKAHGISSLALVIREEGGSNKPSLPAPVLVSALRMLGEAAGDRLQKLALTFGATPYQMHRTGPEVLRAVGSHFPRLTHLRLGRCRVKGSQAEA